MTFATTYLDRAVRAVDHLEIATLPPGRRTRLVVEIAHDGMGRVERLPVIVVRGRREGPVLGITCALHGNELNGIPVAHRLIETLDPQKLRGAIVVAPVLNLPGYLGGERFFLDGVDLNHIMPGIANGNESAVYAHRVFERIVSRFDVLIDLHTASFGRKNSLYIRADMRMPLAAEMALQQRAQIVLHNPAADFTLRGAAEAHGIPAITVEIGDPHVFQPKHIRPTLAGIRATLVQLKMLPHRPRQVDLPHPVFCHSSAWCYTSQGGLLEVLPPIAERVREGEIIARQTDIFGDLVAEYHAPWDGIVIGKSVNPVARTGSRILHLGRIVDGDPEVWAQALIEEGMP